MKNNEEFHHPSEEWIDSPDEKLPTTEGEYELTIFLSTDGKHTVKVKVSNPKDRRIAIQKAVALYDYVHDRYGTKQRQAVKEYAKGASDNTEASTDVLCPTCGMKAVERRGTSSKTGKPYHALFCSSENQTHTKWMKP